MIITKKVLIEVSNRNIFHFRKKLKSYYDLKIGFNEIYVKDLSEGSHVIVEVECDSCLTILKMEYRSYCKNSKNETEIYCCKKCNNVKVRKTNLERYGVVSNSQLKSNKKMVKEKWQSKTEDEKNLIVNNRKETCLEKYGVDTYTKTEEYKIKSKETWMERYGVENPSYSETVREKRVKTKLKNFGFINNSQTEEWKHRIYEIWQNRSKEEIDIILENRRITCNLKYGVDNYTQTDEWREKTIETCRIKYGYPSHNQCPIIHDKQQKSGLKTKKYDNTELVYQGTYELDFLEKYHDRLKIEKINPIQYFLNENSHYYHPDFYLPEYNLIIEVKSSYTYNYDLDKNLAKKEYSIKSGYNFMFIIDKDYTDLNSTLCR
jgi:hypothetical protein